MPIRSSMRRNAGRIAAAGDGWGRRERLCPSGAANRLRLGADFGPTQRSPAVPAAWLKSGQPSPERGRHIKDEQPAWPELIPAGPEQALDLAGRQVHEQMQAIDGVELDTKPSPAQCRGHSGSVCRDAWTLRSAPSPRSRPGRAWPGPAAVRCRRPGPESVPWLTGASHRRRIRRSWAST